MLSFPKGRGQEDVFLKSGNAMCKYGRGILLTIRNMHVFSKEYVGKKEETFDCGTSILSARTLILQTPVETKELNSMTSRVPSNLKHRRICTQPHRQVKQPTEEEWRARAQSPLERQGGIADYTLTASARTPAQREELLPVLERPMLTPTETCPACTTNPTNNRDSKRTQSSLRTKQAERGCLQLLYLKINLNSNAFINSMT